MAQSARLEAIRDEVKALSVDERIALVQAIWDSLAAEVGTHEPSGDLCHELDLRVAELDANPGNVLTWDRIKAHVRSHHP